jgi:hypothetical protein
VQVIYNSINIETDVIILIAVPAPKEKVQAVLSALMSAGTARGAIVKPWTLAAAARTL